MLDQVALFKDLPNEEILRIAPHATFFKSDKHEMLYTTHDTSNPIYFLIKGCVKVGAYSSTGKEVIKTIIYDGEMFGEFGIIGEKTRANFAQALTAKTQICSFELDVFMKLMAENPNLNRAVVDQLARKVRRFESRLESLAFKDARTRIIDFIKESAMQYGRRIGFEMLIRHHFTHQDIASLTGTSRQTVTSVLNELKKLKLIHIDRKSILIHDMASLK